MPGQSLRALMSKPDRFEHHLVVVARAGDAVMECTIASEPLAFAHRNISDEYALILPTGDPLLDAFQARTFVTGDDGRDVARVKHGVGDLVLNPHGFWHWPGRMKPPYAPFELTPGRKRGLSLVICAAKPTRPGHRRLGVTPGREEDAKRDLPDVPLALVDTRVETGVVGEVAGATLEVLAQPGYLLHDGWLVDLETADLYRLPGDTTGVRRGLLFYSPTARAEDPPPIPAAPFAPFEAAAPGKLPYTIGDLTLEPVDDATLRVRIPHGTADVPRYWMARLLFRVALHGFRLGRVETYGGFFVDDRRPALRAGVRDAPPVVLPREAVEWLYRAAAPPGYRELNPVA